LTHPSLRLTLFFVIDNSTKLLEASAALLWPFIVAVLLWKLFPAIRGIVTSRNFSVKVGGIELSVQDATEQIRLQIEDLQKQVIQLRSTRNVGVHLDLVEANAPGAVEQLKSDEKSDQSPRKILWVDDRPSNNAFEIAQLRKEGVDVEQVSNTDEALSTLTSGGPFAAIISDMGRMESGRYHPKSGSRADRRDEKSRQNASGTGLHQHASRQRVGRHAPCRGRGRRHRLAHYPPRMDSENSWSEWIKRILLVATMIDPQCQEAPEKLSQIASASAATTSNPQRT
jgi:hypothetical protein